jgi:hypothetical protein
VVFDEDSFSLAASPSLTDLDFLCESSPTVSTTGTHLTIVGTSPPAPRRPAPEIPPGFEPLVANLPSPVVPPGFLPRAATTAAPSPITIGPPPRTWSASPVTYVRQEVGAGAARTRGTPGAALRGGSRSRRDTWRPWSCPAPKGGCWSHRDTWRPQSCPASGGGHQSRGDSWRPKSCLEPGGGNWSRGDICRPRSYPEPRGGYHSTAPSSVRGQGVVVPITPSDNPHRMITRGKTGFKVVHDRLVLTAMLANPLLHDPLIRSCCACQSPLACSYGG